jgi:CBS domain-containing membrane protein
MNLLAPISTIMTPNPISVSPDETLQVAQEIFEKYKIHHIPVVFEGELVGMLSKSDFSFFKRGFNDDSFDNILVDVKLNNYKVKSIMTTGLGKLEETDRINVALDIFRKNIFHALPVVNGNRIVGIITTQDIINALAEDNEAVNKYE